MASQVFTLKIIVEVNDVDLVTVGRRRVKKWAPFFLFFLFVS